MFAKIIRRGGRCDDDDGNDEEDIIDIEGIATPKRTRSSQPVISSTNATKPSTPASAGDSKPLSSAIKLPPSYPLTKAPTSMSKSQHHHHPQQPQPQPQPQPSSSSTFPLKRIFSLRRQRKSNITRSSSSSTSSSSSDNRGIFSWSNYDLSTEHVRSLWDDFVEGRMLNKMIAGVTMTPSEFSSDGAQSSRNSTLASSTREGGAAAAPGGRRGKNKVRGGGGGGGGALAPQMPLGWSEWGGEGWLPWDSAEQQQGTNNEGKPIKRVKWVKTCKEASRAGAETWGEWFNRVFWKYPISFIFEDTKEEVDDANKSRENIKEYDSKASSRRTIVKNHMMWCVFSVASPALFYCAFIAACYFAGYYMGYNLFGQLLNGGTL